MLQVFRDCEGGEVEGWVRDLEEQSHIAPLWEVFFQLMCHPVPQVCPFFTSTLPLLCDRHFSLPYISCLIVASSLCLLFQFCFISTDFPLSVLPLVRFLYHFLHCILHV